MKNVCAQNTLRVFQKGRTEEGPHMPLLNTLAASYDVFIPGNQTKIKHILVVLPNA